MIKDKFKIIKDADIHIFFNYEKSEYCKLVETGEYKPIFKRVCT